MAIFYNFYTTSNHLHSLQVENCDSNSLHVVDEDDNGELRPERVNVLPHIRSHHTTIIKQSLFSGQNRKIIDVKGLSRPDLGYCVNRAIVKTRVTMTTRVLQ